jgi:hypothetical protein
MPRKRIGRAYGFGFLDLFRGPRHHAPPQIRKFLEQNKGQQIVSMEVGKVPINSYLARALNFITRGQFEEKRRQLGYNDINHAYVILTLGNGQQYRLEKNHVVEISKYKPNSDQKFRVHLENFLPVDTFLENAEKYQRNQDSRGNFWTYDATNNNCQYFVKDILEGNQKDIVNVPEAEAFSYQPKAGETISNRRVLGKILTDTAAALHRYWYGSGVHSSKHPRYRHHHHDPVFYKY